MSFFRSLPPPWPSCSHTFPERGGSREGDMLKKNLLMLAGMTILLLLALGTTLDEPHSFMSAVYVDVSQTEQGFEPRDAYAFCNLHSKTLLFCGRIIVEMAL